MGAQWKAKGKAQAADARGKLFGRLAKDIMVAARGGADPASNSRLRLVVEQARKVSMPKDTLERAIKKGAGLTGEAVHFEHVMYEGFAPHQIPVMVECLTDNVKRTAPEMRVLFRKGHLGASGSVAWDFDHVGMIEAEPVVAGSDPEVAAIEAGAEDFEPGHEEGTTLFLTAPHDLDLVSRALPPRASRSFPPSWATNPKTRLTPRAWTPHTWKKSKPSWPPSTQTTMCRTCLWAWRAKLNTVQSRTREAPFPSGGGLGWGPATTSSARSPDARTVGSHPGLAPAGEGDDRHCTNKGVSPRWIACLPAVSPKPTTPGLPAWQPPAPRRA